MSLVEEREVHCKLRNGGTVLETTWPALDLQGYLSKGACWRPQENMMIRKDGFLPIP